MKTPQFEKEPLYIAGATATGKSNLALELARQLGGEIISVDSMQVYRGLDIGTDKPSPEIRQRIRHHLIDVIGLEDSFNAGEFVRLASSTVKEIQQRGAVPIFCGGTGMYFQAWLKGLLPIASGSLELRAELAQQTLEELKAKLENCSARVKEKMDFKNRRHLERAVEIFLIAGEQGLESRTQWEEDLPEGKPPFFIVLNREKEALISRINSRVETMCANGWLEETEKLLHCGLEKNRTALQAIGYRQWVAYLRSCGSEKPSFATVKEEIKLRTRQFAKRQRTWFRGKVPYAQWVDAQDNVAEQAAEIAAQYQQR